MIYYFSIILLLTFFSSTTHIFADPTDSFLGEEINFEEIFSDLPHNFDLEHASSSDFNDLPYFSEESAYAVVSFRDSMKAVDSFRETSHTGFYWLLRYFSDWIYIQTRKRAC